MKNIYQYIHSRNNILFRLFRLTGMIVSIVIVSFSLLKAQKPSDSLVFATNGDVETTVISGDYLYLGGAFTYIGKKVGPVAFFLNGSAMPEKNMPIIGDIRPYWMSDRVFAVLPDGEGGWFLAGNFSRINHRQPYSNFVHILKDKTVDPAWNLNWESGGVINVLKSDGDYIYVGGTMAIKDKNESLHQSVCRINRKTKEVDTQWNPDIKNQPHIDKIEISRDKVFLSGWRFGEMEGYPLDALAVVDKTQGKHILFPTTSEVTAMKLMGDTLLIGQPNLYWSAYSDGFGYIAKGIALLNEQTDIPMPPAVTARLYTAIPDGSTGWYVAGRYETDGVFHLDKDLQNITTFTQDYLTGFGYTTRLLHVGNYLYVATPQKPVVINGKTFAFLYRLNAATGKLDTTFRPKINAAVLSLASKGDTLFFGGDFDSVSGKARSGFCAINTSTGNLLSWNPKLYKDNFEAGFTGGTLSVKALKTNNRTLYIGGRFQVKDSAASGKITRIYGLARYDLQTGNVDTAFHIYTSYYHNPLITGIAIDNDNMYLAGNFDLDVEGLKVINAGVLNLTSQMLRPVNRELNFNRSASYVIPQVKVFNNTVYFWGMGAANTATGESRRYFVSLNTSDNSFTKWNPRPNGEVSAFSMSSGKILLSGGFYFLDWYPDNFVGININTLKYVRFPDLEDVYDIAVSDKYIFIGGNFTKYADSTVDGLVRLHRNDLSFTSFPHKIKNNNGRAAIGRLSLGAEGLYVVGRYSNRFNFVNGVSRQNICLLNPETAELKAWNPPPFDDEVNRVFSFGEDVVMCGNFGLMPAWERHGLAKINLKTNSITDWNSNITGWFPHVYSLLVSGDTVYIGGKGISKINGTDAGQLSAVSSTSGTLIQGFTPSKLSGGYGDDLIYTLAKRGHSLYAAGEFKEVNGKSHNCIVKLDATTGTVEDWDPKLDAGWNPVFTILPLDTTVFIGGTRLQVENASDKGFLMRAGVQTGAVKKVYPASYGITIRSLAINDSGVLAAASNYSNGLLLWNKEKDTLAAIQYQPEFKYGLYKIKAHGTVFMAAGNRMKEFNSYTEKPGFIVYNPTLDTVTTVFSRPLLQGDINTFASHEKWLIFAGDFDGMNAQAGNSNIAFMQMPDLRLKPGVTSWSPKTANTADPFTVSVYGNGFSANSSVKLLKGNKTIASDSMTVTNSKIIAWFNGTSFSTGTWNLQVKIDETITKSFTDALRIIEGTETDTWVDWAGPNRTLARKPTTYYVLYGNRGNRDAYGVFLYVATDDNQTVTIPNYIRPPEMEGINWDTVPGYVETDYFLGEPFKGRIYTIFLPYLPKQYEGTFKLTITSTFATHHLRVAISNPIYNNFDELMNAGTKSANGVGYDFFSCMYSVAGIFADLTPGISCIKSAFDNTVLTAIDKYMKNESIQAEDVANSIGMTALGCIPGEAALSKGWAIAKGMASMYSSAGDAGSAMGACGGFAKGVKKLFPDIIGFESHDPNAKYGPGGANTSPYIRSDMPYSYMVSFENDSAATAAAQRVIITDTLDTSVFDISSFKAVGFGFGDTSYMFKRTDGDTVDIDLRPDKQAVVRVFYHLEKSSGILTWTFLTLNPNTFEIVEGINDGFLPPNQKAPEGEGNILYSITPFPNLAEGTEIKNSAHIVFDWNNEIPTDTWRNVTDNTAPESAVNSLPDYEVDKDFTVSWKGSDVGSSIYSYTVYVAENDSAYYPWITDTHNTYAIFSGTAGVTYKFYTVATDSAGNKEIAPATYDAITRISGTGIDHFGEGSKMQFRLYPNPAKLQLNMDCYLPERSNIRLDVLNVCGHVVIEPIKSSGTRGTNKITFDVTKLAPGYYFVRILTKYGIQIRKVIIQ